jgi:hypothetical protein
VSKQPIMNPERKRKLKRRLSLLLVLLALGLRVLYVPSHLAQEEHFGPGGHPFSHASEGEGHADDGHDHDNHPRHSALDHTSELTVQRAPSQQKAIDLPASSLVEGWSLQIPRALSSTREPEPTPPKQRPQIVRRPRGPPTAA